MKTTDLPRCYIQDCEKKGKFSVKFEKLNSSDKKAAYFSICWEHAGMILNKRTQEYFEDDGK